MIQAADCLHHASGKFVGAGSRSNYRLRLIPAALSVTSVHSRRHSCVGIDQISRIFEYTSDLLCILLLICKSSHKVLHIFFHGRRNLVHALLRKIWHQPWSLICAAAGRQIKKPLQIAGNENIHRRGGGKNKLSASVVNSCLEKVKQYLIVIGSADQPVNRNSQALGKISSQNISKVSSRNRDINGFSLFNLSVSQKLRICVNIINNLRHQTADINRVGGRKSVTGSGKLCGKFPISENLFHTALGVVKISGNRCNRSVASLLGHHLKFLYPAHASLRIENNDFCPLHICEAGHSGLSRIAWSSRKDYDGILYLIFSGRCRHKMRQNGKGHILKCNRTSVEQLQIISSVSLHKGSNLLCVKFGIIGSGNTGFQFLFCKICQKQLHNLISCLLIAHGRKLS